MIIDCRLWKSNRDRNGGAYRVLVNGVEVRKVWYVDTGIGVAKTYDVFGDGIARAACTVPYKERQEIPGWDASRDDVLSKTIYGEVTLQPIEAGA